MNEDTTLRTLYTKFYSDGVKNYARTYPAPIHYFNKTGVGDGIRAFRNIDVTVQWFEQRRGWGFLFANFQPFCPEFADDWFAFRDVFQGKDQTFMFRARTAAHVAGRLSNNQVIYDDAFGTGVDLVIIFTRHKMIKTVRFRQGFYPSVDTDFDFVLRFPDGVEVHEREGDGTFTVLDPLTPKTLGPRSQIVIGTDQGDGQKWYTRVYPVRIWDSGVAGQNTGMKQGLVPAAIAVVGGATVLRKRVQASFFTGAVGDVYTDATITPDTNGDTYYGTSFEPGPNPNSTSLNFGGWGDAYYDFFLFDDLTTGRYLRSDQVSAATMNVYAGSSGSVNDAVINTRRLTSSWTEADLSRTNAPTENTTNRGTLASTVGGGWKAATITTLVEEWLDGTNSNFGLKLHPTVTSNQNNGNFDSSENVSGNIPYIEITLVDLAYTRQSISATPSSYAPLTTEYSAGEKTNVSTDDATRVSVSATVSTHKLIHQFKYRHTNATDAITPLWNGQASTAPSSKQVKMQIYNHNTPGWEDLDSDNATAAATDFDLTGTISTNTDRYYDANNYVYVRIIQDLA